jgi:hypothetical protein
MKWHKGNIFIALLELFEANFLLIQENLRDVSNPQHLIHIGK